MGGLMDWRQGEEPPFEGFAGDAVGDSAQPQASCGVEG